MSVVIRIFAIIAGVELVFLALLFELGNTMWLTVNYVNLKTIIAFALLLFGIGFGLIGLAGDADITFWFPIVTLAIGTPLSFWKYQEVRRRLAEMPQDTSRFGGNCPPNCAGRSFADRELNGQDFSGADLTRANLRGAGLRKTRFSNAVLVEADLSHADMTYAELSHANLTRATLSGVDLVSANLTGAILIGADLRGVNLSGCTLAGAQYDASTNWPTRFDPDDHGASLVPGP